MNEVLERLDELVRAIKNSDEELENKADDIKNVEKYTLSFPNYFNAVINHVVQGKIYMVMYDGEEYRDRMTRLDQNRRQCHIMATDAVNKLNRMAMYYGTSQIFRIDRKLNPDKVEDREVAMNLVFRFCGQTFIDEVKRSGYNLDKDSQDQILQSMIANGDRFQNKIKKKDEWER